MTAVLFEKWRERRSKLCNPPGGYRVTIRVTHMKKRRTRLGKQKHRKQTSK
jgi:hypothetical protein